MRTRPLRVALPLLLLLTLIGVWALASSRSGSDVLPSPGATFSTTWRLVRDPDFLRDLATSFRRIMLGFVASASVGLPIGFGLATMRSVRLSLGPLIDAFRYAPVNAFIPLSILVLGIGDLQKTAVIVLGTAPYLAVMTSDVLLGVRKSTLETARLLGATRTQEFFHILVPHSLPGIWDALRVSLGLAWTYLLTAELVGANVGVGAFIMLSQRFFQTEEILASVLLIALIGFASDAIFRQVHKRLFRWFHLLAGTETG